jgi:hypothetical protein
MSKLDKDFGATAYRRFLRQVADCHKKRFAVLEALNILFNQLANALGGHEHRICFQCYLELFAQA